MLLIVSPCFINMFDKATRQENSKLLTSYVERIMVRLFHGNRSKAGWNVFILHTILIVVVYYLLLWSKSKNGFLIGLCLWILLVLQHMYFDSCWGVKSERRIWRAKDWYGPWTSLFNLLHRYGMPPTKPYHNVFFIMFTIILGILAVERYIRFHR